MKGKLNFLLILCLFLNFRCVAHDNPSSLASDNRIASDNQTLSPTITNPTVASDNQITANGKLDQALVNELKLELLQEIRGDGNKINDPVVSWILAFGYASAPICIFLYLVGHRFKFFRKATDKLKGKSCSHKDNP